MKKEEFIKLGIDEEIAKKCELASIDELKLYIPKVRFDEVNEEKKRLDLEIKDRDSQLEALKNSTGDVEDMKKQIETLQSKYDQEKIEAENKIKEMAITNAVKMQLVGKVHDEDLVAKLIDLNTIKQDDTGNFSGIEEQIESLKKNKEFLFISDDSNKLNGAKSGDGGSKSSETEPKNLTDAITSHFNK